jgi:hypothetical protein
VSDVRRERLTVVAIPQGAPFAAETPFTVTGAVEVALMP